jgi:hypothetical protein
VTTGISTTKSSKLKRMDCINIYHIHILEKLEDTKGVIRIHISKKNRQHNGQKRVIRSRKTDKITKHHVQNTTQKTKDRVTRTPVKTGVNLCVPEG